MDSYILVARHAGDPVALAGISREDNPIYAVLSNPHIRRFNGARRTVIPGECGADVEAVGKDFLELGGQFWSGHASDISCPHRTRR